MWQQCAVTARSARVARSTSSQQHPSTPSWFPARRFSHLHVDIVGPLPASSEGYVHLLIIIDRSTGWFEAVPMKSMEASTWVDAFISTWVACFGAWCAITTDRGKQFTSSLSISTCTRLGIQHILTTSYHPQSNGLVERMHRQIKDALCAHAAGPAQRGLLIYTVTKSEPN
jgi:transposase InsO family protein